MTIHFHNQSWPIADIKLASPSNETERSVLSIIQDWLNPECLGYHVSSSGSTGAPTPIFLSKKILTYSASTSLESLDPKDQLKAALLCLSPRHIGGLMVVLRALIRQWDLYVMEATTSTDSFEKLARALPNQTICSMVPMQATRLLAEESSIWPKLSHVLIGGAGINEALVQLIKQQSGCTFYHTYGMTETASHVALKNLSKQDEYYTAIGDVEIKKGPESQLQIRGTVTGGEWLQTTDIVDIMNPRTFRWLGRADFVINSGGIKLHPEAIESCISKHLVRPIILAGIPDELLGQRAILLIESPNPINVNFDYLRKYEKPKEVVFLQKFSYTASGKIDRKRTVQSFIDQKT